MAPKHKFVSFISNQKCFGLIEQGGVGPHRLAMRSPIFFLFFGKKVRVTRPTLYHEPTIKAPNIGYIKFSLPLLTGPPEIIGIWDFCRSDLHQFLSDKLTLFQLDGKDYAQYIDFPPPNFSTIRWPWLKESSLWVLRSDKFEFGFDSITHHRSIARAAGPKKAVGTDPIKFCYV